MVEEGKLEEDGEDRAQAGGAVFVLSHGMHQHESPRSSSVRDVNASREGLAGSYEHIVKTFLRLESRAMAKHPMRRPARLLLLESPPQHYAEKEKPTVPAGLQEFALRPSVSANGFSLPPPPPEVVKHAAPDVPNPNAAALAKLNAAKEKKGGFSLFGGRKKK